MTESPKLNVCEPTVVLAGDLLCLERECDCDRDDDTPDDAYCDNVKEELVCVRHTEFAVGDLGYEDVVNAAPWPCEQGEGNPTA